MTILFIPYNINIIARTIQMVENIEGFYYRGNERIDEVTPIYNDRCFVSGTTEKETVTGM